MFSKPTGAQRVTTVLPAVVAAALVAVSACASHADTVPAEPASRPAPPITPLAPATSEARGVAWVDLAVGDCLAAPPPTDPSVVTVQLVDCAAAHAAEVFRRAPVGVDAAVAGVADRECASGLAEYTGRPASGSPYGVTYLIDSNQDRTTGDSGASTVICLLQDPNGKPLTRSAQAARR